MTSRYFRCATIEDVEDKITIEDMEDNIIIKDIEDNISLKIWWTT